MCSEDKMHNEELTESTVLTDVEIIVKLPVIVSRDKHNKIMHVKRLTLEDVESTLSSSSNIDVVSIHMPTHLQIEKERKIIK